MYNIKSKSAVVVGGVIGIGLACVKQMLKCGAGKIVVIDYNSAVFEQIGCEIEEEFGENKVTFVKADVVCLDELDEGFKKAKDCLKNIDIVLNNAGILNENDWSQMVDINFKGPIRGTQLGLKYLGCNNGGKGGAIVNMASFFGLTPNYVVPVYEATKAGLIAYTRSIATTDNFNCTGVRIMTMCPGFTDTDILKGENVYSPTSADQIEGLKNAAKDSKIQKPEDVAEGVVYAIQNGCTGAVFMANEGSTYELDMMTDYTEIPSKKVV